MSDLPKSLYDENGRPVKRHVAGMPFASKVVFILIVLIALGIFFAAMFTSNNEILKYWDLGILKEYFYLIILVFAVIARTYVILLKGKAKDEYCELSGDNSDSDDDCESCVQSDVDEDLLSDYGSDEDFDKKIRQFQKDNSDFAEYFDNKR